VDDVAKLIRGHTSRTTEALSAKISSQSNCRSAAM
jgi:hypothetical protein